MQLRAAAEIAASRGGVLRRAMYMQPRRLLSVRIGRGHRVATRVRLALFAPIARRRVVGVQLTAVDWQRFYPWMVCAAAQVCVIANCICSKRRCSIVSFVDSRGTAHLLVFMTVITKLRQDTSYLERGTVASTLATLAAAKEAFFEMLNGRQRRLCSNLAGHWLCLAAPLGALMLRRRGLGNIGEGASLKIDTFTKARVPPLRYLVHGAMIAHGMHLSLCWNGAKGRRCKYELVTEGTCCQLGIALLHRCSVMYEVASRHVRPLYGMYRNSTNTKGCER